MKRILCIALAGVLCGFAQNAVTFSKPERVLIDAMETQKSAAIANLHKEIEDLQAKLEAAKAARIYRTLKVDFEPIDGRPIQSFKNGKIKAQIIREITGALNDQREKLDRAKNAPLDFPELRGRLRVDSAGVLRERAKVLQVLDSHNALVEITINEPCNEKHGHAGSGNAPKTRRIGEPPSSAKPDWRGSVVAVVLCPTRHTVWITGIDASEFVDDGQVAIEEPLVATQTRTYETAIGTKTVLLMEAIDAGSFLSRLRLAKDE